MNVVSVTVPLPLAFAEKTLSRIVCVAEIVIGVVYNVAVVSCTTMRVTLSFDHRVVDGVVGSKFLQTFKGLLENPVVLLGQAAI